ncbi:MAG: hypothetical protein IVW53_12225 [Chloroflexi bacterium]|nr:hypothetical protein [Chloroflexota bacterium]
MPDIDFAFLADAADTTPGQKFHVLGGGISRIGGPGFPLRHPHVALVVSLSITVPEFGHEHEVRIVCLGPDGAEVAPPAIANVAFAGGDGHDTTVTFAVDLWNLTFPAPGEYSFRVLINGSERKRLPLAIARTEEGSGAGPAGSGSLPRPDPTTSRRFDA